MILQNDNPIGFDSRRNGRERRLPPGIAYLFNEVLQLPPAVRAYHLSQFLAELCPDRALLEVADQRFSLQKFADAGGCTLHPRPSPYGRWLTSSKLPEGGVTRWAAQVWLDVEWRDRRLEVLIVYCADEGRGGIWRYFVLAETLAEAEDFFVTVCAWNAELRDELLVYDGNSWDKNETLFAAIKGATFETLILRAGTAEAIRDDVLGFFTAREMYERYGAPWQRGILFAGPPGNGKTHAVKALVNDAGQRCLYVQGFTGGCSADEESIHEVFDQARTSAPCILVLEDLDALVTKRNRSVFLNEMDGFAQNSGILTLATTNHPEKLDPALADRPSRFDRTYRFDLPTRVERERYIARWNEGAEAAVRLDAAAVPVLAEATESFSFAYLKELFLSSLLRWVSGRQEGSMEAIVLEGATLLRRQMSAARGKRDTGDAPAPQS